MGAQQAALGHMLAPEQCGTHECGVYASVGCARVGRHGDEVCGAHTHVGCAMLGRRGVGHARGMSRSVGEPYSYMLEIDPSRTVRRVVYQAKTANILPIIHSARPSGVQTRRAAQHRGTKHCKDRLCILERSARGILERTSVGGRGLASVLQPVSEYPRTRPCPHSCPDCGLTRQSARDRSNPTPPSAIGEGLHPPAPACPG
eukprot:353069-Chlamydomonas_euryale.AAC.8